MKTALNSCIAMLMLAAVMPARADSDLILPTRLISNESVSFYTKQDVCQHSKTTAPEKRAAMVIVKTHYCDRSSQVCLKTTALVADPANHFVHDNFTLYQSRFENNGRPIVNAGEKAIRDEWVKDDSGPEFYIMDVNRCEIVFRDYAYSVYRHGMHRANTVGSHLDFEANYRAMRRLLLQDEVVRSLLDNKYQHLDEPQIRAELAYAGKIRQRHAQKSLSEVLNAIDAQDAQNGLKYQ
ncbi:MAG: hypothetical protein KKE30_21555 [Gammaproteobacteria bacterium]|nr:hypothetical protein [Gammaproteobacteria bacterium]MBU1556635.1 hypothetical protein [Gammaproteobacteria bacterium]MBU2069790.1 hypothetical protein [Gammaproteobacteria bacterium]MBU2184655.1 hypothetical protein [Gammaproteobacteria bacterium]MBU2205679.1 hypothetical protein [Gammaproteobacteria bacterium]